MLTENKKKEAKEQSITGVTILSCDYAWLYLPQQRSSARGVGETIAKGMPIGRQKGKDVPGTQPQAPCRVTTNKKTKEKKHKEISPDSE